MSTGTHSGLVSITGVTRVRAVFDDNKDIGITRLSNNLYDLTCLMWVSYYMASSEALGDRSLTDQEMVDVELAVHDTTVDSITYNSPLEIYLTISALAGSVTGVGTGLIHLYNQFHGARLKKSNVEVGIAANDMLLEEMRLRRAEPGHLTSEVLDGAASALASLHTLEVRTEDL